jgi:membrane-associated phospholipid phosphatase
MVLDYIFRDFLFDYSIPHLKMIEASRTPGISKFFAIISELSDKYAYIVYIGFSYQMMDVPNAFVVSLTIYTALGVLSILKSINNEARPFFITDIVPTKCWLEYGNPSGHSITSISLYLTMWKLICRHYSVTNRTRYTALSFTLMMAFLIAFSRIYNGVHTYN